ncbi:helix-turn-helix protein [Arcticibacter tournemirensis]|uniref:helix-turn-helix domain-containing protein n=1 Tax=Arcticibacter tournemirensis TaxID=699437 RepID=UPI001151C90B|nr:helix-turn-helix domain-containing protein [Arcticibacter tournemirensis]TQM49162.1 helix-turn-helix protein [Arcticibacter tournemirensis]
MSIKNELPRKGKLGKESNHSDSFRIQVALEYLDGDYSQAQVEKKYGLPERSVYRFVNWYNDNQKELMQDQPVEAQEASFTSKELAALEKKLSLTEMKIAALEKVIAMANEEYRTDLKKKAVTR